MVSLQLLTYWWRHSFNYHTPQSTTWVVFVSSEELWVEFCNTLELSHSRCPSPPDLTVGVRAMLLRNLEAPWLINGRPTRLTHSQAKCSDADCSSRPHSPLKQNVVEAIDTVRFPIIPFDLTIYLQMQFTLSIIIKKVQVKLFKWLPRESMFFSRTA